MSQFQARSGSGSATSAGDSSACTYERVHMCEHLRMAKRRRTAPCWKQLWLSLERTEHATKSAAIMPRRHARRAMLDFVME